MTPEAKQEAVKLALDELLNGKHFSVCTLDNLGAMLGVEPRRHRDYAFLHSLHCRDYSTMSQHLREQVAIACVNCLRPDAFDTGAIAFALMREGKNFMTIEDTDYRRLN